MNYAKKWPKIGAFSSVGRITAFNPWVVSLNPTGPTCPFVKYNLLIRLSGKGPHYDGYLGLIFQTMVKTRILPIC